jgi:class 3 adenylate cyclase
MEAPPLERKLAAIFAADVAGYSRLMEANEERTLATLSGHRRIVDDLGEQSVKNIARPVRAFSLRWTPIVRQPEPSSKV